MLDCCINETKRVSGEQTEKNGRQEYSEEIWHGSQLDFWKQDGMVQPIVNCFTFHSISTCKNSQMKSW